MDDHIIRIFNSEAVGHVWKMTVDLKELAASAGVRKNRKKPDGTNFDDKVVSVPVPRAKKLLQLIRRYGTEEDFRKCDEYLKPNARLHKYWRELWQKSEQS